LILDLFKFFRFKLDYIHVTQTVSPALENTTLVKPHSLRA